VINKQSVSTYGSNASFFQCNVQVSAYSLLSGLEQFRVNVLHQVSLSLVDIFYQVRVHKVKVHGVSVLAWVKLMLLRLLLLFCAVSKTLSAVINTQNNFTTSLDQLISDGVLKVCPWPPGQPSRTHNHGLGLGIKKSGLGLGSDALALILSLWHLYTVYPLCYVTVTVQNKVSESAVFTCESSYCIQCALAIAILSIHSSIHPFVRPSHGWISQNGAS